jgi:hypothetical protein
MKPAPYAAARVTAQLSAAAAKKLASCVVMHVDVALKNAAIVSNKWKPIQRKNYLWEKKNRSVCAYSDKSGKIFDELFIYL